MPSLQHKEGELLQVDYLENTGGINITDTPFTVRDDQALDSYNFDYVSTGGMRKRYGMSAVLTTFDAQLKTLGMALHVTPTNTKTFIRAAGTKIQKLNSDLTAATNLSEDTVTASTDFLSSSSTQAVVFNQFNTANADSLTGTGNTLWAAGGGLASIYGVYNASTGKVTKNGAAIPAGSLALADTGSGSSSFSTGSYYYAVCLYKASTQVISNAALDASVTVTAANNITVSPASLTAYDTTKYTQFWIFRSALSGSSGFTTGALVAKISYDGAAYALVSGGGSLNTSTGVYTDTGTSILSSTSVPRANSVLLDNSVLPSGTYNTQAVFKRRLVTCTGSTVYLSDLNKPESWPTTNPITIPSGGDIKGLAIISFTTNSAQTADEFLVIFKERELWVITGEDYTDWSLKFIDYVGCSNQAMIVGINGFIAWIDYRGVYLWSGSGKPMYCSRSIEKLFQDFGDLDKSYLSQGWGTYYRKYNQVVWCLSHNSKGIQKFLIKLDMRLTLPQVQGSLDTNILDGIFTFDNQTVGPMYAGAAFVPPNENDEVMYIADNAGQVYKMYYAYTDNGSAIDFNYKTKFLAFGQPGITKKYHKVLVYVNNLGAYPLTLNYWTDYRTAVGTKSTKQQTISTSTTSRQALWDVAVWDATYWDDYTPTMTTLVFNLSAEGNNAEGDCLQLQFSQNAANQPVTIYGYSILYSELGSRK